MSKTIKTHYKNDLLKDCNQETQISHAFQKDSKAKTLLLMDSHTGDVSLLQLIKVELILTTVTLSVTAASLKEGKT